MTHTSLATACSFFLLAAASSSAQVMGPMVTMAITPPSGQVVQVTARESGLATVTLPDGTAYGFRPTIQDQAHTRTTVTVFRMGTATEATREIGTVEVRTGAAAVKTSTTPSFTVAIPSVTGSAHTVVP
jgi:hypothetical protein